jgi:hypothetical protein
MDCIRCKRTQHPEANVRLADGAYCFSCVGDTCPVAFLDLLMRAMFTFTSPPQWLVDERARVAKYVRRRHLRVVGAAAVAEAAR